MKTVLTTLTSGIRVTLLLAFTALLPAGIVGAQRHTPATASKAAKSGKSMKSPKASTKTVTATTMDCEDCKKAGAAKKGVACAGPMRKP